LACLDELDKRAGERDADATALKAEGKELDAAWHGGVAIGLREACDKVRQIIQANAPAQAGRASDVRLQTERQSRPCLQPDG
jgi:hypothetical protein